MNPKPITKRQQKILDVGMMFLANHDISNRIGKYEIDLRSSGIGVEIKPSSDNTILDLHEHDGFKYGILSVQQDGLVILV